MHQSALNASFQLSEPASPAEYAEYFEFRWRELRAPWDQPRGSETDTHEDAAHHVTARTTNAELIGIGRIHLTEDGAAQIRYMATQQSHRGLGVGTAIVRHLERIATARGAREIVLNARVDAVAFYERLGYEILGDGATLFGAIAHKRMRKRF